MTPDNKSIIDKVRKVLALTNNPNKNEAENAMLLAQRMMAEHNLVMSDVDMQSVTKEAIDESIHSGQKIPWWYVRLSAIIANNFRCYAYRRRGGITHIRFIGLREDVELAKTVFQYAIEVITYNCSKHVEESKKRDDFYSSVAVRNAYIAGFLVGLKEKFAEQVSKQNWGLIIVKDAVVTQKYESMHFRSIHSNAIRMSRNMEDKIAGYNHGKQFQFVAGKIEGA